MRRPGITRKHNNRAAAVEALRHWAKANGGQVALASAAGVSEAFVSQTLSGAHSSIADSLLSVIGWTAVVSYMPPTVTVGELRHA
ncbi:MAG TPA: hypothetical protein VN201_00940 [Roseateles sp.]|nr:hypothetical protein [Roseateles sp.]